MTTLLQPPPNPAASLALDPSQKAAAEAPEGPVVITGGPGTGKSHTLVRRLSALLRGNAKPATIAYLTYTRKAADIARSQISLLIPDEAITKKLFVGTFHAYASTYLRHAGASQIGRTPHYTVWDQDQAVEIIDSILQEYPEETNLGTKEKERFISWMGVNKARWGEEPLNPDNAFWHELQTLYDEEKLRQNTIDLDDVVYLAVKAMESDQRTRTLWSNIRSRHILVDEFHDITPTQYRLLELMTGPTRSITVASDPNQCIYAWRGADPTLIERFGWDHPKAVNHHLRMNYRSTSTLTDASKRFTAAEATTGLYPEGQAPSRPPGPITRLVHCPGIMQDLVRYIVAEAQHLNAQGIPYEEMAVLAKTNSPLDPLSITLSGQAIPHHIVGATRHPNRDSTKRLLALLTTLLNPMDLGNLRNAACTEPGETKRGLNPEIAKKISQLADDNQLTLAEAAMHYIDDLKPSARSRQGLEYFQNAYTHLDDLLAENLLPLKEFMDQAQKQVLNGVHHSRKIINPQGTSDPLAQIMTLAAASTQLNREPLRDHLTRFLETAKGVNHPDMVEQDAEDPFEPQAGIALSTIHKAKGQQWTAVWLIDASDHIMPGKWVQDDTPSMAHAHRLFYVALTRATDYLYICNAARNSPTGEQENELTRFIDPISVDAELISLPTTHTA